MTNKGLGRSLFSQAWKMNLTTILLRKKKKAIQKLKITLNQKNLKQITQKVN